MTTRTLALPLSASIIDAAQETHDRLLSVPFYARLKDGRVSREEYAAWLIQHYKFVKHTVPIIRGLVEAMAHPAHTSNIHSQLYEYGKFSVAEEGGHDILILMDLAELWATDQTNVLGRIEEAPTSPAVEGYCAHVDMLLARHAEGIAGVGLAFETFAGLVVDDIMRGLLENSRIDGIHKAVAYLNAHRGDVEDAHAERAAEMVDILRSSRHRGAAMYFGKMALTMYEGMIFFLNDRYPA